MKILAIETSCDETAAAVVEKTDDGWVRVLGEAVASSNDMYVKTGGIVPEVAAREQLVSMMPVIAMAVDRAIANTKSQIPNPKNGEFDNDWVRANIDAVAVTRGPGLIGSLLVGVETAKALAVAWNKPLVPVNHLLGHLYANFVSVNSNSQAPITKQSQNSRPKADQPRAGNNQNSKRAIPELPAIALIVSGGHTELVVMKSHPSTGSGQAEVMEILGGTRDDAAGECLDKCARILGLPYPGGPSVAKLADEFWQQKSTNQKPKTEKILPRPLLYEDNYEMSFSGLKIAVMRELHKAKGDPTSLKLRGASKQNGEIVTQLAYELQEAVVEVLVGKLMKAVEEYKPKSVLIAGGVAANSRLREEIKSRIEDLGNETELFIPEMKYCTDNAVMVGAAACYQYKPMDPIGVAADPGMDLSE